MTIERQRVRLRDGRDLSWIEYGPADGAPVLFTIETPSSGLGAAAFAAAADRAGLRLLSLDRPGYGQSGRDPKRTMVRFGRDVAEAVDQIGLTRVLVADQSGGGPHAMSVAATLGDRVPGLLLLSSYGPVTEPWLGNVTNGFMRSTRWQAGWAPFLLPLTVAALKSVMGAADRLDSFSRKMTTRLPAQERETLDLGETRQLGLGIEDAFRSPPAVVDELFALGSPWGFRVDDVVATTHLWHGTYDDRCHIDMARQIARRLPDGTLHKIQNYGHTWYDEHLDEAFGWLAGRAA